MSGIRGGRICTQLNTGYTRNASETRTCNDAACHGADLKGGRDGAGCETCHSALVPDPQWRTNCTWCHGTEGAGPKRGHGIAACHDAILNGSSTSSSSGSLLVWVSGPRGKGWFHGMAL